jgi:hypothetical protein
MRPGSKPATEADEVIDLTERLAPYYGSDVRPKPQDAPQALVDVDAAVWTPMDFGPLYQTTK